MGFYSKRIFPFICDKFMKQKNLGPYREETVKTVRGNILEIGFGTGANLKYYPQSVKEITVLEPNAGMERYSTDEVKTSHVKVKVVPGFAESMPFDDDTFDTVVSTFTLCSVGDPARALDEIHRVLKPSGRFLFFEHGYADRESVNKWQNRLNKFNSIVADGCNINRNFKTLIEGAAFKFEKLDNFYLADAPKPMGYIYKGIALK